MKLNMPYFPSAGKVKDLEAQRWMEGISNSLTNYFEQVNKLLKFVPTEFNTPSSISTAGNDSVGTWTGSVSDVQTFSDGNTYDGVEVAPAVDGTGLRATFDFEKVGFIRGIMINSYYNGNSTHYTEVQLWDYASSAWKTQTVIFHSVTTIPSVRYIEVPDCNADCVSNGLARIRLEHSSATAGHDFVLDYIALTQ